MSTGPLIAAVVAALVAAVALYRRRQLGSARFAAALLAALGLAVYASGVLSELPDAKELIEDVAQALGQWTYVLVGVFAFLETGAFVGLVAPGETVVIAGGVIAGQGTIDLLPLIGLVWACAILGDSTSFFIGRRLGRGFLERHGPRVKITEERLKQVERYFSRHGGKTILIGRFIGLVRALAPFVAGSSRMRYARFIPFSVVGTGLWATAFCALGYVFWRSFDRVANAAGQATFAFGVLVGTVVAIAYLYRRFRHEEERRRLERRLDELERGPLAGPPIRVLRFVWRRLLRPVWRAVAPQVRFLWNRVTPGELGLELTTALAIAGAGLYAFVLYSVVLAGDPGLTPFDREVLDLAREMRSPPVVDVAKVATDFGALPAAGTAVGVSVLFLAVKRRPYEALALLVGVVVVYLAVDLAKAAIERPRPDAPLVGTSGSAFPSGHAAYSTAWVAIAVALTRGGLIVRGGVVLGAVILSVTIGLSRIYLGAHFWSDVIGGWGLGAGVFGGCAAIALIVSHIRQNEPAPEPVPDRR